MILTLTPLTIANALQGQIGGQMAQLLFIGESEMALQWLRRGAAAQKALQDDERDAEKRGQPMIWRYWMPEGTNGQITFLDGVLDKKTGQLEERNYHEHQLQINGKWTNWFTCTATIVRDQPCPVCEGGDRPYLASPFTVIDHREWTDKNGKMHQHEIKLYVAKLITWRMLQAQAAKRGGLAGCTFDVMRMGDSAASVGSNFEFVQKRSLAALRKEYKFAGPGPLDYGKHIPYKTPEELREMGFGTPVLGSQTQDYEETEYEDETQYDNIL